MKLDDSWALGLNDSVAHGRTFGVDIVFAFGPYSSIFSHQYHPAVDGRVLLVGLYLTLTYWIAVVELTRKCERWVGWALWLVLAGLTYSRDGLMLSYPLLIGIVCCRDSARWSEVPRRTSQLVVACLFSSLGLLPLVKCSSLVMCGLIGLITCILFARHRRWDLVACAVGAAVATMALFWLIAGQPLLALPKYLRYSLPLIFGYADAMALPGQLSEVVGYLICAALFAAAARSRRFVLAVYLAFLFTVFKACFVRHVSEHLLICTTALPIAALFLAATVTSRLRLIVIGVVMLASVYLDHTYIGTSPVSVVTSIGTTYARAGQGIAQRLFGPSLDEEYDSTMAHFRQVSGLPVLPGTTDVYSYEQTALIASGNTWDPRPVIQSYGAYGATLGRLNREHLEGPAAPDHIFFKLESIDWRLPPLEDGSSWPALLSRYRAVRIDHGFLILDRRAQPLAVESTTIKSHRHRLGTEVGIPQADGFVFAEIDVKPSLLGRLAAVIFKPSGLTITVNLVNGQTRTYRFIPNIASLGFMISPLVEDTREFATLYGGTGYLDAKQVRSFVIDAPDGHTWWRSFGTTFRTVKLTPDFDPRPLYELDKPAGTADDLVPVPCEGGGFDWIAGIHIPPPEVPVMGLLDVQGWFAKSLRGADIPTSVFLVLTDAAGVHRLFDAHKAKRTDVGDYEHDRRLDAAGFAATIDVSQLAGRYTLGVGFKDGDHLAVCSTFKYSLNVTPVAAQPKPSR